MTALGIIGALVCLWVLLKLGKLLVKLVAGALFLGFVILAVTALLNMSAVPPQ